MKTVSKARYPLSIEKIFLQLSDKLTSRRIVLVLCAMVTARFQQVIPLLCLKIMSDSLHEENNGYFFHRAFFHSGGAKLCVKGFYGGT